MSYDDNVHIWNKWAGVYSKLIFPAESSYADLTLNIIKSIEYTDKILEVATGTGMVSLSISPYCKSIDAIDNSTSMIQAARHNMDFAKFQNVNFSISNADSLSFKNDAYDVVILSNALHVLKNPDAVIKEIRRVLKPDGKLIIANFLHSENLRSRMIIKSLNLIGYPVERVFNESTYHNYLSQFDLNFVRRTVIEGIVPLAYSEVKFNAFPK